MAKNNEENLNTFNVISATTNIVGNINADTDMRIDGQLEGDISSTAKLVIGNKAVVIGNVTCKNAEVFGQVKGKIVVEELLLLHATAIINGDIVTGKFAVEPDAIFNGNCLMNNNSFNGHKEEQQ